VREYTTAAGEGHDVVSIDGQGDTGASVARLVEHANELLKA